MESGGKQMSERILESILGELKGVNQRLDRMDQRFDRIETTLDEVKVAVLETNEAATIDFIKTEQQRHGKIIEALAVKSFEHDTEIRELKRAR
jgi:hypothetical protein